MVEVWSGLPTALRAGILALIVGADNNMPIRLWPGADRRAATVLVGWLRGPA